MHLSDVPVGTPVTVHHVGGDRAFRRRVMELGLLPGTRVEIVRVAPLGDPLELRVRGCHLSIRKREAACVTVRAEGQAAAAAPRRALEDGDVARLEVAQDTP